jgi:hypothetical protein
MDQQFELWVAHPNAPDTVQSEANYFTTLRPGGGRPAYIMKVQTAHPHFMGEDVSHGNKG